MTIYKTKTTVARYFPTERRSNRLLAAFGSHAIKTLTPVLESVILKAGDKLYDAGWTNDHVYFPHTAVISHIHNSHNGESVEISMVGSEGQAVSVGQAIDRRSYTLR